VKGQHAQTHLVPLLTVTVVVSVVPDTVPLSPLPVSPEVSCQGALPSSNADDEGDAASDTDPAATQTVWSADGEAAPPLTATEHHPSKFFTVSETSPAAHVPLGAGVELPPHAARKTGATEQTTTIQPILCMRAPCLSSVAETRAWRRAAAQMVGPRRAWLKE
jgi:hypothetical protein